MSVNVVSPSTGALSPIASRGQFIQYSVMPTPSVDIVNKIVQYIGTSTVNYTNGYFYKCTEVSTGVYNWVNIQVQTGGGGSAEIIKGYFNPADDLFYEESTYVTPITGDVNSLYLSLDTNLLYRYNGTIFVEVSNYEIGDGLNLDDNTLSADTVIFTGTSTEWNAVVDKSKYDIVNLTDEATGEVVDAVENGNLNPVTSNAVYDGLSLKANITAISNPNLLDNPWFTINQRGQTQYTGGANYAIDRWKRSSARSVVDVTDYGIVHSTTDIATNNGYLFQVIENDAYKKLNGKICTVSILYNDNHIESTTGVITYYDSSETANHTFAATETYDNGYVYVGYNKDFGGLIVNLVTSYPSKACHIKAIKLELGSVSTLAMDTAPNTATELLKCQRYFVRYKAPIATTLQTGMALTANGVRVPFYLPNTMRIDTPTISYSSLSDWGVTQTVTASGVSPTSISRSGGAGNMQIIEFLKNGEYIASQPYMICAINAGAYIDFSADL